MASQGGFRCACFFTHNYYSRLLNGHFRYIDKDSFLREYGQRLALVPVGHGGDDDDDDGSFAAAPDGKVGVSDVIAELEEELQRRTLLGSEIFRRKAEIIHSYVPKHPHLYRLSEGFLAPEFIRLVQKCREGNGAMMTSGEDGDHPTSLKREASAYAPVFSFPVFTPEFCSLLMEELKFFEDSPLPKGRPNTMNRRGILLDELLGFERGFVDVLREEYVQPIVDRLMPGYKGTILDSQKAFTVSYREDEDVELSYHYDNAEVTLNVCLGDDFTEGQLYFGDVKCWQNQDAGKQVRFHDVAHVIGRGILHLGAHRHGALPIGEGERHNLILWFRSSPLRNKLCPMCGETPSLVRVEGGGDGFTDGTTAD